MILLDTNVVSEATRLRPHPAAARFFEINLPSTLYIPSIVLAELRYGLARLPPGRRKQDLEAALDAFFDNGLASQILDFDAACAAAYALVRTRREAAGRPVSISDALIGATALAHGATLATRNTADFDGYGLTLIDPWQTP